MKTLLCFVKADLRQKNLLFWDWIFPFLLMIGASIFIGETEGANYILGGLLAFLMLQCFVFGIPFRISEYREKGSLQLIAEEGKPVAFLGAFISMKIIIVLIQFGIFLPLGSVILGAKLDINYLELLLSLLVSLIILGGMSLFVAVIANKQQTALGLSQMLYLLLTVTSGIFYPLEKSPELLRSLSKFSPLTYVHQFIGGSISGGDVEYIELMAVLGIGLILILVSFYYLNRILNRRNRTAY